MAGFESLGELLGGGDGIARQNAFYKGQMSHATVDHLSAQTQAAMEQARLTQVTAKQKQDEEEQKLNLADSLLKIGVAKTPEEASAYANIARGGFANFPQLTQGRGELQTQGFRGTLADPNAPLADRLGASSGIQGKVQVHPEDDKPTPAISNYNFETTLPNDQAKAGFRGYAQPDKIITAGGVPYSVSRQPGAAPRAVVDPSVVAANTGAITGAKTQAAGEAKRTLDLPAATQRLANSTAKFDRMEKIIDKLSTNENLWKAVGTAKSIAAIPGTEGADLRAMLNTLRSQVGFAVLQDLRDNSKTGGAVGNVSDYEQQLLQNNLVSLDDKMSVPAMREQLANLKEYLQGARGRVTDAFHQTYPDLTGNKPANQPANSGPLSFKTEAEAEAAGVKPGTKVVIGGVSGTWQ